MNLVKINFFKNKIFFSYLILLIFFIFNYFIFPNVYAVNSKQIEEDYTKQRETSELETKQHKRLCEYFYDKQTIKQKFESILQYYQKKSPQKSQKFSVKIVEKNEETFSIEISTIDTKNLNIGQIILNLFKNIKKDEDFSKHKEKLEENIFTQNEKIVFVGGEHIKFHLYDYFISLFEDSHNFKKKIFDSNKNYEQIVEDIAENYFNYVFHIINMLKKYPLEDYLKIKSEDNGKDIYISERDESEEGKNLKRTQLFSYEPASSNLQFQIEFLNVFYKIQKELFNEINKNFFQEVEEILKEISKIQKEITIEDKIEEIINNNNLKWKNELKNLILKQKLFEFPKLNSRISQFETIDNDFNFCPSIEKPNNKKNYWQNKKDLISFIENSEIEFNDRDYGQNKKDLISFIENNKIEFNNRDYWQNKKDLISFIENHKIEFKDKIKNQKNKIILFLEKIQKFYAQLVFQISCFDEDSTYKDKMKKLNYFLINRLNKMEDDYLKKIDEKKTKFEKYMDFLKTELETQERDITKRYEIQSPDIIYLQKVDKLIDKLKGKEENDIQQRFLNKKINFERKKILSKYDEIKKFIEKNQQYLKSKGTSSKSKFQSFINDYCSLILEKKEQYEQIIEKIKEKIKKEEEKQNSLKKEILEEMNELKAIISIIPRNLNKKDFLPFENIKMFSTNLESLLSEQQKKTFNDESEKLMKNIKNDIENRDLTNSCFYSKFINLFFGIQYNNIFDIKDVDSLDSLTAQNITEIEKFFEDLNPSLSSLDKFLEKINKKIEELFYNLQNNPTPEQMLQMITENQDFFDNLKQQLNDYTTEIDEKNQNLTELEQNFETKMEKKYSLLEEQKNKFQKQKNFLMTKKKELINNNNLKWKNELKNLI
ncbi:hypothetical protein, partial [Candidatus Phytoplasma pini]